MKRCRATPFPLSMLHLRCDSPPPPARVRSLLNQGLVQYQSLAQKLKVPFSRVFFFFFLLLLSAGLRARGAISKPAPNSGKRKKSTKIKFLGPETAPVRVGGLPREGVVAENFVPALETLSSLGFEERNPGCPGNFAGMSRTPGGVQKVSAKKTSCAFFVLYKPRYAPNSS